MAALRIVCALAILLAVAYAQTSIFDFPSTFSGGICSGVVLCIKENDDRDCNTNTFGNRQCANGLFCKLDNFDDPDTGRPKGTCTAAAGLGEVCGNSIPCYDPLYPNQISCSSSNNGTCQYTNLFVPGDSCLDDANHNDGGCRFANPNGNGNGCNGGRCDTLSSTQQCYVNVGNNNFRNYEELCPANTYCDTNSAFCANRKDLGSDCNGDIECDPLLTCTTRGGSFEDAQCLEPFFQEEGDLCSNNFDCKAGLFCDGGICIKSSPFKKDFCTTQNDCQNGWGCQCLFDNQGDKLVYKGGKCTLNSALTGEDVKRWKKYQQCAKDTPCVADYWYVQQIGSLSLVKDTCSYNCLKKAGYDVDEATEADLVGECFSSAAAVFPIVAMIFAALVAVLGF
jgi:hypothetical protein